MKRLIATLLYFFLLLGIASAASTDFHQCANKNPTLGVCDWIGSIIQQNNSQYFEGMSVLQRILITNVTSNGPHSVSFTYQYSKSGIHGYDFLTTTNQGNVPPITLNACQGGGGFPASDCNSLLSGGTLTLVPIPADNYISKDGDQNSKENAFESAFPGGRFIQVYSSTTNAFTSPSISTLTHNVGPSADTGDSEVSITINFNSTNCGNGANQCKYLIYFGGHLALTSNGTGQSWGPGLGSSQISGGPYHIKDMKFDGSGGSQDNQIKGADILLPPKANLKVIKNVINDNGGTKTSSDFSVHVYDANLLDVNNSPQAGSASGTNYELNPGTYTVGETGLPSGYSQTGIICDGNQTNTITMQQDQNKVCTITNNDIPAKLTVTKILINDNGGTKQTADFNLFANSTKVTSGIQNDFNAGNYTVSETQLPGYSETISGDCASNGAITLNNGDIKECIITNDDIAPTLTLVKTVINDNGGTKTVSDFELKIDGSAVASGNANSINAGAHTASETQLSGYNAFAWGGDCDENGNIVLAIGENKICTITNNDIAPTLTLIKTVINDNGGTLNVNDFNLFIGQTQVTSGETNVLNAGTHNANETTQFGYAASNWSGDCDTNGNVTLAVGENKTCNITNDDIQPKLTVIKNVINDNGGTATASDFNINVTGTNANPNNFNGNENGTTVNLDAGTYNADETETFGYEKTLSQECNSTINIGEEKTCYITNDDIQPKLTVTKIVINDNGGTLQVSDFNLFVNSTQVLSGIQNGFNAGTYLLNESANSGYDASISGDCNSEGIVTLAVGEEKNCSIINNDIPPTLTVIKIVVNDNGGTKQISDFPLFIDTNAVISGNTNTLNAGTYTVSETNLFGYNSAISGDCDQNGSVILSVGENKTCYITNKDIVPKLTINKIVVNDNGGTLQVSDFPLFADNTPVTSGIQQDFNAGTYNANETTQAGYQASAWSGDCDENGNVTLSVGQEKTCNITNNDIAPTLTLVKTVINDNGGTLQVSNFPLFIDQTQVTSGQANVLNAGSYNANETEQFGYQASVWGGDCDTNGNVTLAVGENKTCTITNDDIAPTLTLIKIVINDNGGTLNANDFNLSIDGLNVASGAVNSLNAGLHLASELNLPGYTASQWSGDCNASGSITLAIGEEKTCIITNNDEPARISGLKFNDHDASGTRDAGEEGLAGWTIFVDLNGNGILDAQEPFAVTDANGNYQIDLNAGGPYIAMELPQNGWFQTSPSFPGTYVVLLLPGQVAENLDFGNSNEHEGTIGFWKNWNRHNRYTQAAINGWLVQIDANSAWLMAEAGYAANTAGMVSLINDATKYCGNKTDQLLCSKRKFLAQYIVLRLNVASGKKGLAGNYNLSAFGAAMSYLGISPANSVNLNNLFTKIEAKAATSPTRQQFLQVMSVLDYINNQGI